MNKVTIIIPCFNQARYLPNALASIFDQTHSDWECIIVNDGSKDNTEEIALEWTQKDCRFKYLMNTKKGVCSSRNAGLNIATGNFIQFLDADDVISPIKFKTQIESLSVNHMNTISICDYFTSNGMDENERIPNFSSPNFKSHHYLKELILRWDKGLSIPIHCFLIPSKLITDHEIRFDESLKNHEDWDFWMKLFSLNPNVQFINKELANYRIYPDSVSRDYKQAKLGFLFAIRRQKKNFTKISLPYIFLSYRYIRLKFQINRQNVLIRFLINQIKQIIRQFPKSVKTSF